MREREDRDVAWRICLGISGGGVDRKWGEESWWRAGGVESLGGRLAGRGSGPGSLARNTACHEFDRGLSLGSVSVSLPPHAHHSTQPMVTWLTTGQVING